MSTTNRCITLIDLFLLLALNLLVADSVSAQKQPTGGSGEITFKISVPLKFKGRVVSGSLRKSEIAGLLDLPVRNGNSDLKEGYGVEMTRPNYERFKVNTCLQWKKAVSEEAYAATTYDMAMESSMIHTCGLLFELQRARLPLKSFVANPRVKLADLNLLPAEILSINSDREEQERKDLAGLTVLKVVAKGDVKEADDKMVVLSYGGFRQSFWEAARGDFNGDGVEDILVFTDVQAEEGTLGFSEDIVLTRTGPTGPLKLIKDRKL